MGLFASYLFIDEENFGDSCIHLYDKLCSSCNHFMALFSPKLMFSTVLNSRIFLHGLCFLHWDLCLFSLRGLQFFCLYIPAIVLVTIIKSINKLFKKIVMIGLKEDQFSEEMVLMCLL